MAGWRYIAQRLTGDGAGEFLDFEVPLSDVEVTDVLSGPDRLTATIDPVVARMKAADGRLLLEEWGTAIYTEADGLIRDGYILVRSDFDGPSWRLDAIGFSGYAAGMPYTDSLFFVQADPLDIVRHIWGHLQSKPGGNIGLVVDETRSPVRIGTELEQVEFDTQEGPVSFEAGPYKLAWYLTDDLGRNIDQLAEDTPFDYDEEHAWAASGATEVEHRLRLYYPRKGRRRDDLRFVLGENIVIVPSVERDGDDYANEVLALGAGEGRDMVRAEASRPDGRLRRVAVVTDKSARSVRRASQIAAAELAARQNLDEITEVAVLDHPHAPIGSYGVGDDILLQGETEWTSFELWVRVLSITISPEAADSARLTVARTDMVTTT